MSGAGKRLLVDGYNVIRRVPAWDAVFKRDMAQARETLLAFCQAWVARRGDVQDAVVVFDGNSGVVGMGSASRPGVKAVYTKTGEEADDRIAEMARGSTTPKQLVVVSDDAAVARTARAQGAETMSVQTFHSAPRAGRRRQAASGEGDKAPLSAAAAKEIDEMMRKAFGVE